jgi:hypothetical protein
MREFSQGLLCFLLLGSLHVTACFAADDGLFIRLQSRSFDPLIASPAPDSGIGVPAGGAKRERHYLVQFSGPLTEDEHLWIARSGGTVTGYIPDYALIVRASSDAIGRMGAEGRARWIGVFEPVYKIVPGIGTRTFQDPERRLEAKMGVLRLVVGLFGGQSAEEVAAELRKTGAEVLIAEWAGDHWRLEIKARKSQIGRIAALEAVQYVEEAGEAMLRNDITKWVIQSDVSGQTPIWDKGIKGENQIGGLIDSSLYKAHMSFNDPNNGNVPGPTHRKLVSYRSSIGQNSGDSHGTHTAGTLAGDHEPIDGSIYRNGMAPHSKIAFRYLGDITSGNLYSRFGELYSDGARVFSNSWGDDGTKNYTSWCRDIDRFMWDNENSLVNFAVTNTSTLKTPENAKSCIGTGATYQAPNQDSWCTGGSGPTNDGRRKPELYAPGCDIWSSRSGTTNGWSSLSGTSMSCPAISGAGLLVRQYYEEGWYPKGYANAPDGFDPSGALVKATLLNASVDMTGVPGYPSDKEGWGRLLLDNALFFEGEGRKLVIQDVRNANGMVTGESRRFLIRVLDNSQPLKITMVYSDYPAEINANPATVNDLDLNVLTISGALWRGNNINTSTGESNQFGANDPRNTVEMVILKQPQPGIYVIQVDARAVNLGGKQGYAVVCSGNIRLVTPGGP